MSTLPEASVLPFGLYDMQNTCCLCPLRVARNLGSCADRGGDAAIPMQISINDSCNFIRAFSVRGVV